MDDDAAARYGHALRTQLAERRAIWEIQQELIGLYALNFDDPTEPLREMAERISRRLDQKEGDANAKGLDLPLAYVKSATDRFFSEMTERLGEENPEGTQ